MKYKFKFELYNLEIPMPIFRHESSVDNPRDITKFMSYIRKYVILEQKQKELIDKQEPIPSLKE